MASTSVHFPRGLLEELDRLATTLGISRNKLIVASCEHTVLRKRQWPKRFFANDHLSTDEIAELHSSADEFAGAIAAARRNRDQPPL